MEAAEVGASLADVFIETVLRDVETSFALELFRDAHPAHVSREYVALQIFLMLFAVNSFYESKQYRGPKVGLQVAKGFNNRCGVLLEGRHFYDDYREFMEPRLAEYDQAMHNTNEPNPLWWLGKAFCQRGGELNVSRVAGVAGYVSKMLPANVELVEALAREHTPSKKDGLWSRIFGR